VRAGLFFEQMVCALSRSGGPVKIRDAKRLVPMSARQPCEIQVVNDIAVDAEGRSLDSTWVGREEFGHVPEH
jgi:hypothetical protein